MYSHLASNDQTGPLDFVDPSGWLRAATVTPLAGQYSTYGKQGSMPWIEIQTDAGPFRLNGVATDTFRIVGSGTMSYKLCNNGTQECADPVEIDYASSR